MYSRNSRTEIHVSFQFVEVAKLQQFFEEAWMINTAKRVVKQQRLISGSGGTSGFGFGSLNFRLADSSGVSILCQPRNGCF